MSKKLLIYGLAFGSASAALSYIYLTSAIYKGSESVKWITVLGEFIIIPAIGIFLFLKAFKDASPETFTMGRAVFMGFFLSIIISASVSLLYSYMYQFKNEYIGQVIDYKVNVYANSESAHKFRLDSGEVKYQEKIVMAKSRLQIEVYSMRAQFVFQLFLGASRGLFFGGIFAYLLRPKRRKD